MRAAGIIFADQSVERIGELVEKRTVASIPFGGRYRLVDFALSNLVNANILKIGIITKNNYQSLMDHIGSGKDWDLSRRNGGVMIFPPFVNNSSQSLYENRLEALSSIMEFIERCQEDQIVMMDCDHASIIDFEEILRYHEQKEADITIVYRNGVVTPDLKANMNLIINAQGRVTDATLTSEAIIAKKAVENHFTANTSINVWVIKRKLLATLITEAISQGARSFRKDIILRNIPYLKIYGYENKRIFLHVSNIANYYEHQMSLLNNEIQNELFRSNNLPIYTKVRDSAPTKYADNSSVTNSLVADGCFIQGTVENSIIFRGVVVGPNSVVKNSILMQDTIIGKGVHLNTVITDKNVIIRDGLTLAGCPQLPYYLRKKIMI